jgi:hypothetical protein
VGGACGGSPGPTEVGAGNFGMGGPGPSEGLKWSISWEKWKTVIGSSPSKALWGRTTWTISFNAIGFESLRVTLVERSFTVSVAINCTTLAFASVSV